MAAIVERSTKGGERRLHITFGAIDRASGERRKVWETQPPGSGLRGAKLRKGQIENALHLSGGIWPAEEPKARAVTFAEYRDAWLADRARDVGERVVSNNEWAFRCYLSPAFDSMLLEEIRRPDVKALVGELVDQGLARNTSGTSWRRCARCCARPSETS